MRALRTAWNYLAGRKKTEERTNLSFDEAVGIIRNLEPEVKVDVVFRRCREYFSKLNITPGEANDFLEREFSSSLCCYHTDGAYQIFSGRENEKHYLDVRQRNVKTKIGSKVYYGPTNQTATLSFLVKSEFEGEK